MLIYTMPENTANQKTGKSFSMFHGITTRIPIMRCGYAALIGLATVFSWNGVMQRSLVLYYGISHISLVFS